MTVAARSASQPAASLAWRAAFAGTLAVAMAAGTLPGYVFGVLAPHLVDEFALTRAQLGLFTTVFFLCGGGLSLLAGSLVDRLGARRVMLGSFVILGLAVAVMAGAPSYAVLLAATVAAGLPLAAGNPMTNKLVALHLAPGRRGIVMGVKQAGVQVGAFLAGAALAPAAAALGWRTALGASLAVPVAGLIATLRVVPRDRPDPDARPAGRSRHEPLGPVIRRLAVYAFLMGAGVAVVNAYLPLYAVERLSLSPTAAGAVAALIGLTGVVCRVAWGWISERFTTFAVPLMVMGLGAALALLLVAAAAGTGAGLLWPAAVLFGATAVTWNVVGMLALVSAVDTETAGRASGIVLFGFYGGFVGSPIAFGAVVDATGSYLAAWAGVVVIFALAALVTVKWPATD